MAETNFTDFHISLDTTSIEGDATSSHDSMVDYMTLGVADAAVSGVVGLYNTGVALGESLGMAAGHRVDEAEAIESVVGKSGRDFYGRHKDGIDAAGFVMSSILPGTLAVKAFRSAQMTGKIPAVMELSTGLASPKGMIFGSGEFAAARASVLAAPKASLWTSPAVRTAYIAGAKQQFLEAAVFDAAIALTNNQNSFISPEAAGYFDATWHTAVVNAPYTLLGGVLGTGIDVFRIKGQLTRDIKDAYKGVIPALSAPALPARNGIDAGSWMSTLSRATVEHNSLQEVGPFNQFAQKQFNTGQESINMELQKAIGELNSVGPEVGNHIMAMIDKVKAGNLPVESIDDTFGFAESITHTGKQEMDAGIKQFANQDPLLANPAPFGIFTGADIAETSAKMQDFVTQANELLRAKGLETLDIPGDLSAFSMASGLAGENFIHLMTTNIEESTQILNRLLGTSKTASEYATDVMFHELSHLKSNTPGQIKKFAKFLDANINYVRGTGIKNDVVMSQLLEASRLQRPAHWQQLIGDSQFRNPIDALIDSIKRKSPEATSLSDNYLSSPAELLADGGAYLTNPRTREIAAQKFPELAAYLKKTGLADSPWNSAAAQYNMRTGARDSAALPALRDIAGGSSVGRDSLYHGGLKKTFSYEPELFQLLKDGEAKGTAGLTGDKYLSYDAQWHIAAKAPVDKGIGTLTDGTRSLLIAENDLPRLERAAIDIDSGKLKLADVKISYGEKDLHNIEDIKKTLADEKAVRSVQLAKRGINENVIERILNIDKNQPIGDKLLMAEKNYDQAEVVTVNYQNRPPVDYANAAAVYSNIQAAVRSQDELAAVGIARALGDDIVHGAPPPLDAESASRGVARISPQESRAGFISAARHSFGSFRERANSVGRYFAQYKVNNAKVLDEGLANISSKLNSKGLEAQKLRGEYVRVTQLSRMGHYAPIGDSLISRDAIDLVDSQIRTESKTIADALRVQLRENLSSQGLDEATIKQTLKTQMNTITLAAEQQAIEKLGAAHGVGTIEDLYKTMGKEAGNINVPSVVTLSEDMRPIIAHHFNEQLRQWERSKDMAAVKGYSSAAIRPKYLQPPQPDLNRFKFNAFVVPRNTGLETSDPRKFAIWAESQAEFEAKLAQTNEHFGNDYKIISTQTDVKLYKEMMNGYNKDSVFHDIKFDPGLSRQGFTGELIPNMDLNISGTFDEWRKMMHKRDVAVTNDAIEMQYRNEVDMLKRLDLAENKFNMDILGAANREPDSILRDTQNLYLGRRSYNGQLENTYGRISDAIGTKGSQILDRAYTAFFSKGHTDFKQENLAAYNEHMAKAGFSTPLKDVFDTVLSSPDPAISKSLNNLSQVMGNLHSTFMLRLDPLNNIMQAVSAPILQLPVMMEAMQKLKAGDLDTMLRVRNPAGGAEIGIGQMMGKAIAEYANPKQSTKDFIKLLERTGIITDYIRQYHVTTDLAELNGRHLLVQADNKIKAIADLGGKYLGFNVAEEFTRFTTAKMVYDAGLKLGYNTQELIPIMGSAVDRVHGIYTQHGRAGMFNGIVGQSVGLYMNYFFNLMQQFTAGLASSDRKRAAVMGAMQSALFGVGSLPGMTTLNAKIASDFGGQDLYGLTGADEDGYGKYMMYGMASHAFGFNVDMFSRGDLQLRHNTVVPLNPLDWAVVGRTASIVSNIAQTATNLAPDSGVPVGQALLQGLAHNGLYRPLQGVGALLMGEITSRSGQALNESRAWGEDTSLATIGARLLGSKPTAEAIAMDGMYRKTAYQASVTKKLGALGGQIQLKLNSGQEISGEDYSAFARGYETAGGTAQNFNKYWVSQLKAYDKPQLAKFKEQLQGESELKNLQNRLLVQ